VRIQWCWRCKANVPMVDDSEWSRMWSGHESRQATDKQAVLDEYERLTGYKETNYNALFHHRISDHGPPCPRCGKVLRTPVAYKCFECGHVVHAPNWSFLFTVASCRTAEGGRTVVTSNVKNFEGRVKVGDMIEVWADGVLIARTAVDGIDKDDAGHALLLATSVPQIEAGQTVRYSPPRCGE
jgi:hypothetical protein